MTSTGVSSKMSRLVTAAFLEEDAEAAGIRAEDVLADLEQAVRMLGGPDPVPGARNAVIQRFGGVGALLVIACEDAAGAALHEAVRLEGGAARDAVRLDGEGHDRDGPGAAARAAAPATIHDPGPLCGDGRGVLSEHLDRLLHEFAHLGSEDLERLLEAIEEADGRVPSQDIASARRWLNVTYAIAARDGTDRAHRAYLEALDRVLASTRVLVVT